LNGIFVGIYKLKGISKVILSMGCIIGEP